MQILCLRIGSRLERSQPVRQAVMESGNQCECTLLRGSIGKIEDSLCAESQGLSEIDIPVQVRARKRPVIALRGMKSTAVRGDPKVRCTPKLSKRPVDACIATVFFQPGVGSTRP